MTEPLGVDQYAARVQALLDARRSGEAEHVARQGLASSPGDAVLLRLLAVALLFSDRMEEAARAAEAAIAAGPESEWAHRIHASALCQSGRKADALDAAGRAVALAPRNAMTYVCLAAMALANKNKALAADAAGMAVRLDPTEPEAHLAAADVERASRRWVEAEAHIRDALALDPQDGHALNTLGLVLEAQGRRTDALDAYAAAAQLDPTDKVAAKNARRSAQALTGAVSAGIVGMALARPLAATLPPAVMFIGAGVIIVAWIILEIRTRPQQQQKKETELSPVAQRLIAQAREKQRHPIRFLPGGGGKASADFEACMVAIGFLVAACFVLLAGWGLLSGEFVAAFILLGIAALLGLPSWRKAKSLLVHFRNQRG